MTKTISCEKQNFFILSLKRNWFDLCCTAIIFFIIALLLSNPGYFSSATIRGLKLFFFSVFPGLFPFMLLTKLLTEIGIIYKLSGKFSGISNRLFGTPGVSIYVLFMSILSGYPIGAKIISDLYSKNLISENDAQKMSVFCTTSGPIFIIGAVGVGMLGNIKLGAILYAAHILSSIILGIVCNLFSQKKELRTSNVKFEKINKNIFSYCINDTINSIFIVAAYITIFYLVAEILVSLNIITYLTKILYPIMSVFGLSHQEIQGMLFGLIEVTRGCKTLSSLPQTTLSLICGIISFSGCSIIMQSLSFLKTAKIKAHTFLFFKCVHCILSIFICKLLVCLCI